MGKLIASALALMMRQTVRARSRNSPVMTASVLLLIGSAMVIQTATTIWMKQTALRVRK